MSCIVTSEDVQQSCYGDCIQAAWTTCQLTAGAAEPEQHLKQWAAGYLIVQELARSVALEFLAQLAVHLLHLLCKLCKQPSVKVTSTGSRLGHKTCL